jgi:hypothetical protein
VSLLTLLLGVTGSRYDEKHGRGSFGDLMANLFTGLVLVAIVLGGPFLVLYCLFVLLS